MSDVWFAFLLTFLAGLSTGIGAVIAFFAKRTNYRFLSWGTGFSGGVMIYVSFVEIIPKALESLEADFPNGGAPWMMAGGFFGGMLLMLLIDRLIPAAKNPHEVRGAGQVAQLHRHKDDPGGGDSTPAPAAALPPTDGSMEPVSSASAVAVADRPARKGHHDQHLMRMGLFTALAITIHNFPEGMVTFLAALEDPTLGIAIAIAIALHNIPEGISVSVPIYYATGSRGKAFAYSLASGLAEPVGAVVGYLILRPWLNGTVMGGLFAAVAGVMVYISLDELLPTSRAYGKGHDAIYGLLLGMAVMALSLLLLG